MGHSEAMAEAVPALNEHFQPVPVRLGVSSSSKLVFGLRRFTDLQLATIWKFLKPRLSSLRGNLLDVGCGEMPYRNCVHPDVAYAGIDVPQATAFAMRGSHSVIPFDGISIPFPDSSFDTVLCTEVLDMPRRQRR